MKMIINADGVREMIKHDPAGTVELARAAAAQVAETMARRLTQERVRGQVDSAFHQLTMERSWSPKLSQTAQAALEAAAAQAVAKVMDASTRAALLRNVHEMVEAQWQAREKAFVKRMEQQLDSLISARLMALLAGATKTHDPVT